MAAGDLRRTTRGAEETDRPTRADIPFPVKQVRSARGELARSDPSRAWALPQLELEVVVDDPFTDDVLSGLFGVEHHVRFVTGNEAVIDVRGDRRVRLRALPFVPEALR